MSEEGALSPHACFFTLVSNAVREQQSIAFLSAGNWPLTGL